MSAAWARRRSTISGPSPHTELPDAVWIMGVQPSGAVPAGSRWLTSCERKLCDDGMTKTTSATINIITTMPTRSGMRLEPTSTLDKSRALAETTHVIEDAPERPHARPTEHAKRCPRYCMRA
eukprot:13470318-Alexandrium_andersonii.AAC.1